MARDLSLGEGAAPMRARVVEREDLTLDVEEGDRLALDVDESCLTGLDLVCRRYLHKVSHGSFPPARYEAHSPAIVCGRNSSVSARST